jgi:hypothetical protein
MIQELLHLAGRAALDPAFLAYHFQGVEVDLICQRLDCSVTTALLIELSATPRLRCWQPDVARLADARGVNASELASLLRDAEAVVSVAIPA